MLQSFMRKFTLLFYFLTTFVYAKEPTMALLISVPANDTQHFRLAQYSFVCKPYGIVSLEELYQASLTNETCKTTIEKFYRKNPLLLYFTSERLYKKQLYHIEFKENRCILYAQGQKTLSELLLRYGLAFVKPFFRDPEFYHSFINAQNNAKNDSLGMWSQDLVVQCMAAIYKE